MKFRSSPAEEFRSWREVKALALVSYDVPVRETERYLLCCGLPLVISRRDAYRFRIEFRDNTRARSVSEEISAAFEVEE